MIEEISQNNHYDIASFFLNNKAIRASEVARLVGISEGIIRQYTSGKKIPSLQRAAEIEKAIHEIGKKLIKVKITSRSAK